MSGQISRRVTSLHIYPIKSCRGISLDVMDITARGPLFDRQWMIVDERGMFQTQRQLPQMAQIETDISDIKGVVKSSAPSGIMRISFGQKSFDVPLAAHLDSPVRLVKVWKSELEALVVPDADLHFALSEFLEKPVWLVQFHPGVHRAMIKKDRDYATAPGVGVHFADNAALLVTNSESLTDLNERLNLKIGMERFRANVVIEGAVPWEEDDWQALEKADGFRLEMTYGCGRCQIINQDQTTGVSPSNEPLMELVKFRRKGSSIEFGMNAVHRLVEGRTAELRVGDELNLTVGPLL